ncbi:hypothetical protein C8A05DRAFT_38131 [Staphylotrichum tortipilum]|uniref:F-box domain-containing protein n=1 Tax=Staphylotrichum tortipilum TaxID=2831512 RepID=A0AAN6RQ23_9PEZI|nr:hypothetical protein C8A05DRAFT_38131 [Staphylotrichum longicolle]
MLACLPNEILSHILGNFCVHCRDPQETPWALLPHITEEHPIDFKPSWYTLGRQVLYSMCLVSRQFRDVTQAVLYHEFLPGFGELQPWDHWKRTDSFLRTVALRPDLASLVRRVYLNPNIPGRMEARKAKAALEEAARARNIPLAEFLKPYRDRCWPKNSYFTSFDEVVAMLLACLPNLASLSFSEVLVEPIPLEAMRAAGVLTIPLRTLEIIAPRPTSNAILHSILNMTSSTLKTFQICLCEEGTLQVLAPRLENLRSIYVVECVLSSSDLASLLSRSPRLECFIYEAVPGAEHFLPCDAAEHLARNRATLQTLHLDIRGEDYEPPENNDGFRSSLLPNLSTFPVLRHLLLNTLPLYTQTDDDSEPDTPTQDRTPLHQILPPSIVSLRLVDYTSDAAILAALTDDLLHLAQAVTTGAFPHLRKVRVDIERPLEGDGQLTELLASANVDFEYYAWPVSRGKASQRSLTPPVMDDDVSEDEAVEREEEEDGAATEEGGETVDSSPVASDSEEETYYG